MSAYDRNTFRVGHLKSAVLDDVREGRRYPHIAYTEHHIAVTLENALTPIDLLHSPDFPDFHTSDLALPLRSYLTSKITPEDIINPLPNDKFKITRAGLEKMKEWSRKYKEKPIEELLEVLETGRRGDPYPVAVRPLRTILTIPAMLDEPNRPTSETPSKLKSLSQLYKRDSKLLTALIGDPGPLETNLDVDKILNLKPRMSAAKAAEIMASRKSMSEGMKKAEERYGADLASAGIWSKWKDRYEGKIQEQPRPIMAPFVPLLQRSRVQIKPISMRSLDEDSQVMPGKKELVDQLISTRGRYEVRSDERGLMDEAQDMDILDRADLSTGEPSRVDQKTSRPRSPRLRPPKRISYEKATWDLEVQNSRMDDLLPVISLRRPSSVYSNDPNYAGHKPESHEWGAQLDISEKMGYWDGDGQDQYLPEEQYGDPDEKSQGYYGYHNQPGSFIPPLQVPYQYFDDRPVPEAIWAQSGQWQGGHRQRDSTSDPTSGDLSNVESIIDTVPRYQTYPRQQPNLRVDQQPRAVQQASISQSTSQPPPVQQQFRRPTKRPYSPGLDAIVAKRAKIANAEPIGTNKDSSDHFEVTIHLHDFVSTRTSGRSQTLQPSIFKSSSGGVRLTSPEFATPLKSKPRPHWRLDPLIKNAKWYNRVISRPINPEIVKSPRHVLATIDFMQDVNLSTALRKEGFENLDEDRKSICGVDVVLSPTTGILFRPLSDLIHRSAELLADVRIAINHYTRVVLVFEVKSYGIKNIDGEILTDDPDPHPPATYTALESFTDTIAMMEKDISDERIGSVKLAFGLNGAGEVGRVIRAMADHPEQEFTVDGDGVWLEGHIALHDEERILEECYAINPYAGRAILRRFSPFTSYVRQWTMEEMLEKLRPIVGGVLSERLVRKVTGPPRMGSS